MWRPPPGLLVAGGGGRVVPGLLLHDAEVVEGVGLAEQVTEVAAQREGLLVLAVTSGSGRRDTLLADYQPSVTGEPYEKGTAMADIAAGGRLPARSAPMSGRRRAAGIYGAIVTAAILDVAGGKLPTDMLVVAVVATLVVYWLAEQYAELLGEQTEGGAVPTWDFIRGRLDATWPMVSASYLPLLALVLARVAGLSGFAAANVGLVTAVVVLTAHAWAAGRSAQLHGRQLLVATSIAAGLGLAMILLKDVVLTHVH